MNDTNDIQQATQETVNTNMASALGSADNTAAQRVQSLGLVHQARLAQLTRTSASIAAQYGANSSQATAAAAAVASSKVLVARIAQVKQQVTVTAPQPPSGGWSLYGHVYTSALAAASAYTVFLVDQQNAYQGSIGFAYTGSDGSYVLNYAPAEGAQALPQLFLEIANSKAQPVYLSTTAFQPKTGSATYLDITLPAGEPALGDPPAEIRSVAMPDTNSAQAGKTRKTQSS